MEEYTEKIDYKREVVKNKLRTHFDGKIVRKDLTKKIKEGANVPVYVLEFLLGQYCSSDDPEIIEQGVSNVKHILSDNFVRPDEAQKIIANAKIETCDFISVMKRCMTNGAACNLNWIENSDWGCGTGAANLNNNVFDFCG